MVHKKIDVFKAYNCKNIETFLECVFPEEWKPIASRIIESGAELSENPDCKFAPKWSLIPMTIRESRKNDNLETCVKSIIFRVHDCLHQLWGLPVPKNFSDKEFYYFKRVWMCSEVSVLTLTEFFYCNWLYETQPDLRNILEKRNTLLFKKSTRLRSKTMLETASILDELLHKKTIPLWIRENTYALEFIEDYVYMLEEDRKNIDHNWIILKNQEDKQYLNLLPNQRYGKNLDGRELTEWMIKYFLILFETDENIDRNLTNFNRERRKLVKLPDTWNER